MATRRMFSQRIVNSARFLKMPISSQALYFHLGIHADDDGVVEAYSVLLNVGCSEDDLKVLVSKGYVQVLNEDLVSYITDWRENNKLRSDRKIDSIYKDLLLSMYPDIDYMERTDKKKTELPDNCPSNVRQLTDKCQADVRQMSDKRPSNVRLVEDSIGEDSIGEYRKESIPASAGTRAQKHKYGSYGHVMLTDEEYSKLTSDFGDLADPSITFLDEYIEMKGYKCKSHYLAIRKWVVDAVKERQRKANKAEPRQESQHHFENERQIDYEALLGGGIIGNG